MFPILLALTVLGLDQFTKWLVVTRMAEFETIPVIPGFFSIQFVYNTGAAFGILQNQTWFLVLVATVAAGVILYYLRRPEAKWGVLPLALGLLLGGTLGNLVDRVRFGKVVDFFLFYWKDYRFPNFNVADIGITVGVALLALYLGLTGEKTAG
ncbi:MAG TPA: signal peptidase II [Symbiobacteriaceae bacterium]